LKVLVITQARLGSSRLPGKILLPVNGKPLLSVHMDRILQAKLYDKCIVATTDSENDNQLVEFLTSNNISYFRGSESNVLDRFYKAACLYYPEYIMRLTSDCPLIDPVLIDEMIRIALLNQYDYISNTLDLSFPDGQDIEIFTFSALQKAWKEAKLLSEKEHVTPFIWKNSSYKGGKLFSSFNYKNEKNYSSVRMTLDEQADYLVISELINALGENTGWQDYAAYYTTHPEISSLNLKFERNEGYTKSELTDKKLSI